MECGCAARPVVCLDRKSGERALAEVRGVVCLEASVSGEVVSEGEMVLEAFRGEPWESGSLRGEYGGGGEAIGSAMPCQEHRQEKVKLEDTIRSYRPRCEC